MIPHASGSAVSLHPLGFPPSTHLRNQKTHISAQLFHRQQLPDSVDNFIALVLIMGESLLWGVLHETARVPPCLCGVWLAGTIGCSQVVPLRSILFLISIPEKAVKKSLAESGSFEPKDWPSLSWNCIILGRKVR